MKERPRRVLYHRDLASLECFEAPIDVNDYVRDFVGRCEGTNVDTFVLHMTYNLYPSKLSVEEYVSETDAPVGLEGHHSVWASSEGMTASTWRRQENMKVFIERGVDPIAALLDRAHRAGIDFFAGIRMNDVHHAQWNWHPNFWVEHPEYRIGDHPEYRWPRGGFRAPGGLFAGQTDDRIPATLDYIHEEVRAYKLSLIEDMARAYDVEGVELDFTRHPVFFKPAQVAAGRNKMNEFLTTLRERLAEIGNQRGKPLVLEVKVPPTLEACWRIGLDVRRRMADDLADIVAVSSYWHPDFGMPVGEFLNAAAGTNCKVFACFELAEMPLLRDSEATACVLRAAALAYWRAGVHGVYLFNTHMFPYYWLQEMPFLHDIGEPEKLEFLDKHYMVTRASNYDDVAWCSYPKELPAVLAETASETGRQIHLSVGDDLAKAARLGVKADVTLRLRVMNLTSRDELEVEINGIQLDRHACKSTFLPMGESGGVHQYPFLSDVYLGEPGPYHWLEFSLREEALPRLGMNEIRVTLRKRNPEVTEDIILNDVEITIEYGNDVVQPESGERS